MLTYAVTNATLTACDASKGRTRQQTEQTASKRKERRVRGWTGRAEHAWSSQPSLTHSLPVRLVGCLETQEGDPYAPRFERGTSICLSQATLFLSLGLVSFSSSLSLSVLLLFRYPILCLLMLHSRDTC